MTGFLLELRTEEIPANALPGARKQLAEGMTRALVEAGFDDATVRVLSTSRRLVVVIDGLPERQTDRTERIAGGIIAMFGVIQAFGHEIGDRQRPTRGDKLFQNTGQIAHAG